MKEEFIHISVYEGNVHPDPVFETFEAESQDEFDAEMTARKRNWRKSFAVKRREISAFLASLE